MSKHKITSAMLHTQAELVTEASKRATALERALNEYKKDSEALGEIIDKTRERVHDRIWADDIRTHFLPSARMVETDLAGLYLAMAEATVDCDGAMLKFNVAAEETNRAMVMLTKMTLDYRAERGDEDASQILSEVEEDIAGESTHDETSEETNN